MTTKTSATEFSDWLAERYLDLARFVSYWRQHQANDGREDWPASMPWAEWDEQYAAFREGHDSPLADEANLCERSPGVWSPSDEELLALSKECEKMPGGRGRHYANYGRALLSRCTQPSRSRQPFPEVPPPDLIYYGESEGVYSRRAVMLAMYAAHDRGYSVGWEDGLQYAQDKLSGTTIPTPTTKAEYIALLDLAVELGKKLNVAWEDAFRAANPPTASASVAPVTQQQTDSTLPYELALSELVDKLVPGLDTGDLLADARQASAAIGKRIPVAVVCESTSADSSDLELSWVSKPVKDLVARLGIKAGDFLYAAPVTHRGPAYNPSMGDAAEAYIKRVAPHAHHLPPTFLWQDLYEVMIDAARPQGGQK